MSKSFIERHSTSILIITNLLTAVIAVLLTCWLTSESPEVTIKQYYSHFDEVSDVPSKIGNLKIEYVKSSAGPNSAYILEIENDGSGPEEDLKISAKFPEHVKPIFLENPVPDLKIYELVEQTLKNGKLFLKLRNFPKDAHAKLSFFPPDNIDDLCRINIDAAGKREMGTVEDIKGIECGK